MPAHSAGAVRLGARTAPAGLPDAHLPPPLARSYRADVTSSTTVHSPPRLYGRSGELAILHGMLARLRQGDGGALVLTAPPGLGR
ncbi:hypothetical protein, partial [Streptomyces microflavus]|uniref:hypothetical protein n=1 Tax=Streptomyces microflavus TaxID=1919 RepID=UPI0030B8B9DD